MVSGCLFARNRHRLLNLVFQPPVQLQILKRLGDNNFLKRVSRRVKDNVETVSGARKNC